MQGSEGCQSLVAKKKPNSHGKKEISTFRQKHWGETGVSAPAMLGNPSQAGCGGGCGGFFSGYIAAEAAERGVNIWVRSGGLVVTAEKNVGEKKGNKMR